MRINNISSTPNFGMALHMPSKETLTRNLTPKSASYIDSTRKELANLAKDVDIFITMKDTPQNCDKIATLYLTVAALKDDPKDRFYMKNSAYNYTTLCVDPLREWRYGPKLSKEFLDLVKYTKSLLSENPSEVVNGERVYKYIKPSEMINPDAPPLNDDADKVLRYVIEHRVGKFEDIEKATNVKNASSYAYRLGYGKRPDNIIMHKLKEPNYYCIHYPEAACMALEHNLIKPEYQERFKNECRILRNVFEYEDSDLLEEKVRNFNSL